MTKNQFFMAMEKVFWSVVIGASLYLCYQYWQQWKAKSTCVNYSETHPNSHVVWLNYQCLELLNSKLIPVQQNTAEPVEHPIPLPDIWSLRYPPKCQYARDENGRVIYAVCDAED